MAASKLIKDPLDDDLGPRCVMCGSPPDSDSSGHPYGLCLICRIEDEKRFEALKAKPVPAIKRVEFELSRRPGWHYQYDGRHPSGHAPSCNCEWCKKGGVMKCCHIAQKEPGREFGIACDDSGSCGL